MKVELNETDAAKFVEVLKNGVEKMPQEELHDIIRQVVYDVMTKNEDMKSLFIKRDGIYGNVSEGPVLGAAIRQMDFTSVLQPFKDRVVQFLMDNHREIVEQMILHNLISNIFNDPEFQRNMKGVVERIYYSHKERND